jgi:hypothetical protein
MPVLHEGQLGRARGLLGGARGALDVLGDAHDRVVRCQHDSNRLLHPVLGHLPNRDFDEWIGVLHAHVHRPGLAFPRVEGPTQAIGLCERDLGQR